MDNLTEKAINEILKEMGCARCKWDADFDDNNTLNDWIAYVVQYASSAVDFSLTKEQQRQRLVKAGGLIIHALVAQDRNNGFAPRHYD